MVCPCSRPACVPFVPSHCTTHDSRYVIGFWGQSREQAEHPSPSPTTTTAHLAPCSAALADPSLNRRRTGSDAGARFPRRCWPGCSLFSGVRTVESIRDKAHGASSSRQGSPPLHHAILIEVQASGWVTGLTHFGAQVHGAEHLDGEVRVDLADDLCGIACEQMRLLCLRGVSSGSCRCWLSFPRPI